MRTSGFKRVVFAAVAAMGLTAALPKTADAALDGNEYAQLEYIGTTAAKKNLYLDTGIHPSETTRFTIRYQVPQGASWDGNAETGMIEDAGGGIYSRFHFSVADGGRVLSANMRHNASGSFSVSGNAVNDWHELTMDASASIVKLDKEEKIVSADQGLLTPESNSTFWLFARNSKTEKLRGNAAWIRISEAKMWNGNTLLLDLVPCERISDGALGMYDIVNEKFLPMEGADAKGWVEAGPQVLEISVLPIDPVRYRGEDTAQPTVKVVDRVTGRVLDEGIDYELTINEEAVGWEKQVLVEGLGEYAGKEEYASYWVVPKIPNGYTPVEYIESTGENEYIDLEVQPTGKTDFRMEIDVPNPQPDEYPTPFGVRKGTQYRMTGSRGNWDLTYDTASYNLGTIYGTHTYEVFPTKGAYAIDGASGSMTASSGLAVPANAYLFAFNKQDGQDVETAKPSNYTQMKVFAFQLWEDGKIVRDLVPCKTAGNVYGLYDLVSKRFFENKGAGAFRGGSELPKVPQKGLVILLGKL